MAGFFDPTKSTESKIADAEAELNGAIENERPDQLAPKEEDNKEKPGFVKEVPVDNGTNWQKRYGDLQRYIDKTLKVNHKAEVEGLKAKITELETKINTLVSRSAPADLPSSVEEIEALKKESPGAYAAIVALATGIAENIVSDKVAKLDTKLSEVTVAQKKTKEDSDFVELQRRNPNLDLAALGSDEQFHTWLQGQPKIFQNAIYGVEGKERDVDDADAVLKMYQAAYPTGKKDTKQKKVNQGKDDVNISSQPELPAKGVSYDYTESQIAHMDKTNPKWFDKNQDAIDKALREGRVLMDISDPIGTAKRLAAQAA